jgi:hypothetical protein
VTRISSIIGRSVMLFIVGVELALAGPWVSETAHAGPDDELCDVCWIA